MVYRIFVEKKSGLDHEAGALLHEAVHNLQIKGLTRVRLLNRYDVENIDPALFERSCGTVFSEPQLDDLTETADFTGAAYVFAAEYLPGQFDQRADSAAQCIQIMSQGERPAVRTARVYALYGVLTPEEIGRFKKHVINPVESREASFDKPETLDVPYEIPTSVKTLTGFTALERDALAEFLKTQGLAMDLDDLTFCRDYFRSEKRDPTITEIKMIDTYWSDHCRHTTFLTTIDRVRFEEPLLEASYKEYLRVRRELGTKKPVTLMNLATVAAKYLKEQGRLDALDESEEINACTVKIEVRVNGRPEKWLLLFKNETHNHPTEIEPFGGAATCIGGAIRDPLSGRAYVYAAMRVTGAADPLKPVSETLPGKLPQRKIVTTAANGYSSYGNQIGLATGQVDEIYHEGYAAKRMEIGAVIAAAPEENVRRERPEPGDAVILLGGRTGRDGCGGATGSSKSHNTSSLATCGAEVQKGNAPEERKLQRLFRNPKASRMIKRCNDFGAGGVSVAIGELADGLEIDLSRVPKKYEGLDGTELAISESQERMAVVVAPEDTEAFIGLADAENLEATVVAAVTETPRLVMRWNGEKIVDLSRDFLNSNGAEKHIRITAAAPEPFEKEIPAGFEEGFTALAGDLNICSKRGLAERFDSTIGANTVLMPFGGRYQRTPAQAMVHKIAVEKADTDTCSFMAWGYNPFIAEKSPYHSAYLAVVESVSKLIASGASPEQVYLTFQEYFEKPLADEKRWGKPLAALLGAFQAQLDLGMAAIGGKDSMSGSFEKLDVPPTLVSFAVTCGELAHVVSPEFKKAGSRVCLLRPVYRENGLPDAASLTGLFETVSGLVQKGAIRACWTPVGGGVAEGILKMTMGNRIGFRFAEGVSLSDLFGYCYGSFLLELAEGAELPEKAVPVGVTTEEFVLAYPGVRPVPMEKLCALYEDRLESIFPCNLKHEPAAIPDLTAMAKAAAKPSGAATGTAAIKTHRVRALIPVFPGTNCEYDTAKAMLQAGMEPEIFVVNNKTPAGIAQSVEFFAKRVREAQVIFIPGGFSGGDEPDGSGKFITAFFRNGAVKESVHELLKQRDGLMCGICNGFQALIKLGLVPYGEILDPDCDSPTLTFNTIGRHQSKIVQTRIVSNASPWLTETRIGDLYSVPISHGEGRFYCSEETAAALAANGQVATQYVDPDGNPTYDIAYNPNGSLYAIEGILSADGRVFGKMGHTERVGEGLYRNVPGKYDMGIFRSAVRYFMV